MIYAEEAAQNQKQAECLRDSCQTAPQKFKTKACDELKKMSREIDRVAHLTVAERAKFMEAAKAMDDSDAMVLREALHTIGKRIYSNAVAKGWRSEPREIGTDLALIHSEISEVCEALRTNGDTPDEHCPEFKSVEIELADAVIRILDVCQHYRWNIGAAIIAKMKFNETRPYRHGGKRF